MTSSEHTQGNVTFFHEFLASLNELKRLTIVQGIEEHIPFNQSETNCPKLVRSVKQIATPTTTAPIEVDPRVTIEKWRQYQVTQGGTPISGRDCKRFCWVPEIVSDDSFRSLVVQREIPITLPSLRGLIYSYHANYAVLRRNEQFTTTLKDLIIIKARANASIKRWQNDIDCIVGSKATSVLAKKASDEWLSPEQQLLDLELNATTSFARQFAQELVELVGETFDTVKAKDIPDVLANVVCSLLVDREVFKSTLATIILSNKARDSEEVQAMVIDFLLKNDGVGDPRIHPENWAGIRDEAKQRVIQWLSREDINFFFELLLRDRDDKHGRKSFWLKYVEKISRSRALVSKEDLRHHAVRLREMEEKGRSYGELIGSNTSSAFVLDFGRIVVVEFSEVGNACYIYKKEAFTELLEEFWAKEVPFRLLKNQDVVAERITRSMKDWQSSARQVLSRFGVRRD